MHPSTNELLASIADAVTQNDDDSVISLLTDLRFVCRTQNQALDTVVGTILTLLAQTTVPGNNCGFQILFWIESHFGELSDAGKNEVKQFVAENYGQFRDTVAEEMADFVGGFRDAWGIGVVTEWIANCETFTADAVHSIATAIREFEDHPSHLRSDDPYRMQVWGLTTLLREKRQRIARSSN